MPPPRIDYEVRTLGGRLLLTSPEAELAIRWANKHAAPRAPLRVERVETTRLTVHMAERALDAAS